MSLISMTSARSLSHRHAQSYIYSSVFAYVCERDLQTYKISICSHLDCIRCSFSNPKYIITSMLLESLNDDLTNAVGWWLEESLVDWSTLPRESSHSVRIHLACLSACSCSPQYIAHYDQISVIYLLSLLPLLYNIYIYIIVQWPCSLHCWRHLLWYHFRSRPVSLSTASIHHHLFSRLFSAILIFARVASSANNSINL